MKRLAIALMGFFLLSGLGCRPRSKEITSLQRKEAASLASEAEFAVTLRDLPRAQGLLIKVTSLCPDNGEYWSNLGSVRMRLGDRDGAKNAYETALAAYKNTAKLEPQHTELILQQVYVLALLGRVEEARKLLEKAHQKFPEDRLVREFVQEKTLDRLITEPTFKEISL